MSQAPMSSDVTSDDKLWALLAYLLSPLLPLIIMSMEDKKNRPFIKAHNAQALVLGVVNVAIAVFLGWLLFTLCINVILGLYMIYLGIQAYQGKYVEIPVITNFVKGQGWA